MGGELKGQRELEGVTFEKDGPLDLGELAELRKAVDWPVGEDLHRVIEECVFYVCARRGGRLVGFVQAVGSPHGDLLIHNLSVHPSMQGKGIGSRLMELALGYCARMRPQGVNVLFERRNISLFKRLGFRIMKGGYMDGPTLQHFYREV